MSTVESLNHACVCKFSLKYFEIIFVALILINKTMYESGYFIKYFKHIQNHFEFFQYDCAIKFVIFKLVALYFMIFDERYEKLL